MRRAASDFDWAKLSSEGSQRTLSWFRYRLQKMKQLVTCHVETRRGKTTYRKFEFPVGTTLRFRVLGSSV